MNGRCRTSPEVFECPVALRASFCRWIAKEEKTASNRSTCLSFDKDTGSSISPILQWPWTKRLVQPTIEGEAIGWPSCLVYKPRPPRAHLFDSKLRLWNPLGRKESGQSWTTRAKQAETHCPLVLGQLDADFYRPYKNPHETPTTRTRN